MILRFCSISLSSGSVPARESLRTFAWRTEHATTKCLLVIAITNFDIEASGAQTGMSMNISLTDKLERFVAEQVKAGRYQSASEVVRDALRLLQEHEEVQRLKLKALRATIAEGLASGPVEPLDMDRVIREARAQYRSMG